MFGNEAFFVATRTSRSDVAFLKRLSGAVEAQGLIRRGSRAN